MSPDFILGPIRDGSWQSHIAADWRRPLARLALLSLGIMVLTARDWAAMADQWWNISTYNHVLFVPFIVGWLIWERRAALASFKPKGWWPGLVLLGCGLFGWLLGTMAGVNTVSQLGAVLALQAGALALLGPRIGWALLFPLVYLLFLVPFGDELVPALQMLTAKITIALTMWSGIPAFIDGVFIDTPAGLFEVAEACSGVKFLVAMLALGTLVAHSCFTSRKRRAAFMTAAIILPILANGVRAWGTIYIAQSQGIEFAAGFDHIFYGWVFFALVVAALLAASWRFFDRDLTAEPVDAAAIGNSTYLSRLAAYRLNSNAVLLASGALLVLVAVWSALSARLEAPLPQQMAMPAVAGWSAVSYEPQIGWQPRAGGADHRMIARYRDPAGREVDVALATYAAQGEGREAGSYGEGALVPGSQWRWLSAAPSNTRWHGEILLARGQVKRLAQTSYRRGDLVTGSVARLKLATLLDRLRLSAAPVQTLILSVEEQPGQDSAATLSAFRTAMGDEARWMDRALAAR
ncbi:hypothetical protein HME9302_01273 [Alteripontixanthobacter maritimus]|uniref:Methanolan biosynthesis EpsI domain-containing protein n=1 Tax=Alteripontixanthobacter maritimus TaxID=2161824 RepID=A0A369Q5S4_9SPHN|nr:exosortase A [Alteripontixanthobacter maritimus]RDC60074.1 hypothetical protein HME9302_01273 [Alteripontixanthobacter maritimus]